MYLFTLVPTMLLIDDGHIPSGCRTVRQVRLLTLAPSSTQPAALREKDPLFSPTRVPQLLKRQFLRS